MLNRDVPHYVYKCFNADGVLLYVGCTSDARGRNGIHRNSTPWWGQVHRTERVVHATRDLALASERAEIQKLGPVHNINHNRECSERDRTMMAMLADGTTLEEVGRAFGVSRQRVQQIRKREEQRCEPCASPGECTVEYCRVEDVAGRRLDPARFGELAALLRVIRTAANEASQHIGHLFLHKDLDRFDKIASEADYWLGRVLDTWHVRDGK